MADAVAEEYKSSLADLNFNSKPHINMLTMLAEDNIKYAPQIVQAIVDHIQTVPPEVKLPGLYLVDSIIKNVGKQYLTLFSQNLVALFSCVFEKVEENTRSLLYKLRQTWNDILPNKILYAVDVRVKKLDPAWPVTAQAPAQSIHINPKFLGSNSQNQPDVAVVKKEEARLKEQTGEVFKQLLEKQEQLRQLEQKKQEIAKCMTSVKIKAAARSLAIANSKVCHRDPRLQKANILSLSKSIENTVLAESIKASQSKSNIPSIAVVPKPKDITLKPKEISKPVEVAKPVEVIPKPKEILPNLKEVLPQPVAEPQTPVQNLKLDKNVTLSKEPVKNADPLPKSVTSSPKKLSFKKTDEQIQAVRNSPSDKSKSLSHKSNSSPNKKQEELCVNVQEHKLDLSNEIEHSPKRVQKSSKEEGKSPRSSRKKSLSPEGKNKSLSRYSRSQAKSETLKKSYHHRSRSPIHNSEKFKSKSNIGIEKEKHDRRHVINDKEPENSEKSLDNNSRDQGGRGRGKRESSVSKDDESKENENAPPEKKIKEEVPDGHSDRSQDSHNLFGKEDQDYRQISKGSNQTTHHKGWAQYKESHPDEFKSPLRPARNSMENKAPFHEKLNNRPFPNMGPNDSFFPPEYDRLGRLRLHRGRPDQRFIGRRGYFPRGPGNRFEHFHPIEQFPKNPLSLPDPQIILQETEAKYRLGRITESEYLDLKRDLEIVLRSEEFRRFRDPAYRMQGPERFRMQGPRNFANHPNQMDKPPEPGPFFNGEPLRIQGPRLPPPEVRSFKLDNKMRTIHFVDEKALVIMDNDEPRELTFKADRRHVFIEGLPDPISLGFDGQTAEFEVDGKRHIMRFGAPSREIYIDNHPYEAKFGGGPFAAMLEENRLFRIQLSGPPPQVVVGDTPQFELFSKFRIKSAAPPMKPIENPDLHRPDQSSGNLPFDVDMRMDVDNTIRKPVESFDSQSGDMKDVDWRQLPPSIKSEETNFFKPVHQQEHWDKNLPPLNNRNLIERNPQNHPDWKNNAQYSSDRPPLLPKEWESMQPPPYPCLNLNGSPRNTPPHDKEWDHMQTFEGPDRRDWRENENRQDMSGPPPALLPHPDPRHIQRNSPINMKEEPSYHDGPMDVMRPNMPRPLRPPFNEQQQMRPRAPVPQYGTWQRPNFRERAPVQQGMPRTLLPPPLPPFQSKPSLLGDGPRPVLEPPPALPNLGPTVESLPEKVLKATTVPVTVDSSGLLTSEYTASETAAPTIDVGSLFQKLVAAGIINSKDSNMEKDEKKDKEERNKEKDSNKEKEPDIEPVPPIELKLESLRKHHSGVISALYRGSQCATCGMRFKEIQSDHYKRHLDWHFRMNRREKDGMKKAFSRRWYYEVEDWYQFEEFEDFEERAPSYFELQADGTQIQTEEPIDVPSVPASGQETEVCVVCDETFQLFWVEEEEEWHLRDAVRHEEQAYHPACYEDHKKASEIPAASVEDEKTPVKEEEPSKESEEKPTEVDNLTEETSIKKKDVEPMETTDTDVVKEEVELDAKVENLSESIEEVKIKEEPAEDILEGKPGEEEVIGLISESEVEPEPEEPKEEPKMVVQSGGGIVLKIKAESMQPQSPAAPVVAEKDESNKAAEDSEGEEEIRPPTPDPRFQVLPPVQRGTELSGLCCIM